MLALHCTELLSFCGITAMLLPLFVPFILCSTNFIEIKCSSLMQLLEVSSLNYGTCFEAYTTEKRTLEINDMEIRNLK
jgi:hypothetical protein